MPELETMTLSDVAVFAVGKWNGRTYTGEDLDSMVKNFHALRGVIDPPAKLGHNEGQELIQADGFPAVGRVTAVRREGDVLYANFADVPKKLGELIAAGAYRDVSSEIWFNVEADGKKYDRVLVGVAFLGDQIPGVADLESLDDIRALYRKRDRGTFGTKVVAMSHTYSAKRAPRAPQEERMAKTDEEAALVGQLERLGKSNRLAAFARETLARFRTATKHDISLEDKKNALQEAVDNRFGGLDGYAWICATFNDRVIVQKGDTYYAIPYLMATDGSVTFDDATEVEQTWTAKATAPAPSGDLPANVPPPEGSGDTTTAQLNRKEKDDMADLKRIALAHGLAENATEEQIVAAAEAAKDRPTKEAFEALSKKVEDGSANLAARDAKDAVDAAIRARKLAPAQREWAEGYAKKDPEGFKAYVEKTPEIFTAAKGSEGDAPPAKSAADEINDKVAAAVKADATGKLTFAIALDQVSRANPDLAKKYVEEQRAARLS
jgi:hypothetical protein